LCERSEELLDNAYAGKAVPDPTCSTDLVDKNIRLGQELQINSTPSLIREDGLIRPGAPPVDMLINWIDGK
jgi:protein-disulfide isomerase